MKKRKLGSQGLVVSELGLGCMGMSQFYGPRDDAESTATLERAIELGLDFFDTADVYGEGHNEELVGKVLRRHRDKVIIATKFGNQVLPEGKRAINGKPEYVRSACDASLKRLGVDHIDLYYQHRVDKNVPIEDTVGAMADLVRQGKVRYLGLSEAAPGARNIGPPLGQCRWRSLAPRTTGSLRLPTMPRGLIKTLQPRMPWRLCAVATTSTSPIIACRIG